MIHPRPILETSISSTSGWIVTRGGLITMVRALMEINVWLGFM